MKKMILNLAVITAVVGMMAACGGKTEYNSGTYTGQSSEDEDGDYAITNITISDDGKITDVEYLAYEKNGNIKGEEYGMEDGKIANEDYYKKAQNVVAANKEYARQLVEVQNPDEVEAISGATISYGQFQESVDIALRKAVK